MKLKNNFFKRFTVICLMALLFLIIIPNNTKAGPRAYQAPALKKIPPGSQRVSHGSIHYFYHKGKFYTPVKSGYVIVRPPIGVIVSGLPVSAATIVVAGMTYYVYESVYYLKIPSGYQVVEIPEAVKIKTMPVETMAAVIPETQVMVTAKTLNVRSGPGLNHPVKSHAYYGDLLTVQGIAPDWIYVLLPDGKYGWVMLQFVSMTTNRPEG